MDCAKVKSNQKVIKSNHFFWGEYPLFMRFLAIFGEFESPMPHENFIHRIWLKIAVYGVFLSCGI